MNIRKLLSVLLVLALLLGVLPMTAFARSPVYYLEEHCTELINNDHDWENPKYPNLFIKKAIDFSTTTDNIKPYIIGDFIKDTFLDEAIENSDSKVGFDNSIDSSVMHIKA